MNYIIEANIGFIFLYGIYELVLARENDFRKQRVALLVVLASAAIFPLISIEQAAPVTFIPTITLPEIMVGQTGTTIDWIRIIYIATIVLIAVPFVINGTKLALEFKKSRHYSGYYITESDEKLPSWSFFNLIYIGRSGEISDKERELILKHEMLHGRLYHSLDIVLVTLLCIVFWFNPVLWIMRRTLAKVHEFEVDSIIAGQDDAADYTILLAKTALSANGFLLTHHFNQSFILKRINMINMIKSKISNWKLAGLGVAIVVYFVSVACSDQSERVSEKPVSALTDQSGEIHSTVDEPASPVDGLPAFMDELGTTLKYPLSARKAGIEGKVFVEFIVNTDGSFSDIKVIKGLTPDIDAESLRAVGELKNWNPGKIKGKAVRTRMVLPIVFKLD